MEGGILQMLNHGVTTGALFLCVGIIYERTHTRMIADFGGLTKRLPIYAAFFMIFTLSSLGLPGMNGFIGEFMILLGAFTTQRLYAVIGTTGIILGAAYMLWMYQRVMFMELKPKNENAYRPLVEGSRHPHTARGVRFLDRHLPQPVPGDNARDGKAPAGAGKRDAERHGLCRISIKF